MAKHAKLRFSILGQFERPVDASLRGDWQDQSTSFDFDAMIEPFLQDDGTYAEGTSLAMAPGYAFAQVDGVLAELGHPVGIPSYRPYHATGEDFPA